MYANAYNKNIANRLKENDKKLIEHQEESNKMTNTPFTSHLEGMALRDEDVVGGSGYAEATVRGEGFEGENTEGARGSGEPNDPPAKKTRKPRKSKEVGGAILGLAEIETDPRGDPSLKAAAGEDGPERQQGAHADGAGDEERHAGGGERQEEPQQVPGTGQGDHGEAQAEAARGGQVHQGAQPLRQVRLVEVCVHSIIF